MKDAETSEKTFEKRISRFVEDNGGLSIKLLSSLFKGLPDRMLLLPRGIIIFVEFKSTGKKPTKIQAYVHEKLRNLGFLVFVVSTQQDCIDLEYYFNLLITSN